MTVDSGRERLERVQLWLGSGIFAFILVMVTLTRGLTWHVLALPVWLGAMYLLVLSRRSYRERGAKAALGWAAGAVVLAFVAVAILIGELPGGR